MALRIFDADKAKRLCYFLAMDPESILAGTATLFMALGDKTRLRLLNLMYDREICVSSFTGTLGQSQPLISRHLAYLRNSGIVEARRDGKWMHYSISTQMDENTGRLLMELFRWMEGQDALRQDREGYEKAHPESEKPKLEKRKAARVRNAPRIAFEPEVEIEVESEIDSIAEYEIEEEISSKPRHNELEDFLL